jgi:hypothetical protein
VVVLAQKVLPLCHRILVGHGVYSLGIDQNIALNAMPNSCTSTDLSRFSSKACVASLCSRYPRTSSAAVTRHVVLLA